MDRWALASHRRAIAARERAARGDRAGRRASISTAAPVTRHATTRARAPTRRYEKIARARAGLPCRRPHHRRHLVRPGRRRAPCACSCPAEAAARHGLTPLARIHTIATGACAPTDLIYSAIPATRRALERSGSRSERHDGHRGERSVRLRADRADARVRHRRTPSRVNPNGGACALGHPVGASGARLVGTTGAGDRARRGGATASPTICGGMGQGAATILERI